MASGVGCRYWKVRLLENQEILQMVEDEDEEYFKKLALRNIDIFAVSYFEDINGPLLPYEDFHIELMRAASNWRRGLFLLPANHGKTVIISHVLPIHEVCKDPNIRIMLCANVATESASLQQDIIREFEDNEKLMRHFGPFKPADKIKYPWNSQKMSVKNRTRTGRDDTIESFGVGTDFFGHRSDLIILDDPLDFENTGNEGSRQKTLNWFRESVMKTLDPQKGRIFIVGTPMHWDDMYSTLQAENSGFEVVIKQAVVDEEAQKVLWPNRWPYDRLMEEKRTQGTLSFEKRFQCQAYPEGELIFKHVDDCLDQQRSVGEYDKNSTIVMTIDPAIGQSYRSSYFSILVSAIDREVTNRRMIVDLKYDMIEPERQMPIILSLVDRYKPSIIVVEANAYQKKLQADLKEKLPHIMVKPHQTQKNKTDPEIGIETLVAPLENRLFSIPWKDPLSRKVFEPLVNELRTYPINKHRDALMTLWFLELEVKKMSRKLNFTHRTYPDGLFHWAEQKVVKIPC